MKTRCSISFSIQLLFLFSLFDFVDVTRIFGLFFFFAGGSDGDGCFTLQHQFKMC